MTRHDNLALSYGATAKARENTVKQDRVHATNAIGHHPERPAFLRRMEFIGGTGKDFCVRRCAVKDFFAEGGDEHIGDLVHAGKSIRWWCKMPSFLQQMR